MADCKKSQIIQMRRMQFGNAILYSLYLLKMRLASYPGPFPLPSRRKSLGTRLGGDTVTGSS